MITTDLLERVKQLELENLELKKKLNIKLNRSLVPASALDLFPEKYLKMLGNDIRLLCFPTMKRERKRRYSDYVYAADCSLSVTDMTDDQYNTFTTIFTKVIDVLKDYKEEN